MTARPQPSRTSFSLWYNRQFQGSCIRFPLPRLGSRICSLVGTLWDVTSFIVGLTTSFSINLQVQLTSASLDFLANSPTVDCALGVIEPTDHQEVVANQLDLVGVNVGQALAVGVHGHGRRDR